MKTININHILKIYIAQGFNIMYEFINRIEYKPTEEHSKFILDNRDNKKIIEEYIKKLLK